jgi:putative oxidoreductase
MFNQLLSTTVKNSRLDLSLLILRIAVSAMMLTHGIPKLQNLLAGKYDGFPDPLGVGAQMSLTLTVLAEFIGSLLLIIGLGTRFALITLMICMLVAALVVHSGQPYGEKEHALLFLLPYVVLWLTGPGKYSLDNIWLKK